MKRKEIRITGILAKHRKGYGFVIPDQKEETSGRDIFISPDDMRSAMNQDQVTVTIKTSNLSNKKLEGKIDRVIRRARLEVIGTFNFRQGKWIVSPISDRYGEEVMVQRHSIHGAEPGDQVVARISKYPSNGQRAEGKITEIISRKGELGGDIKALVRSFQVKEEFPDKVIEEALDVSKWASNDLLSRRDLRGELIFTIDGADAKDLDDAVSIARLENGHYRLGVHIADVSHYVRQNSALDEEALFRGTSIYLIDQVIPMLPPSLSNGVCSLNPNGDRLTLSIDMVINEQGQVVSHEIYESVICSKARLIYTAVSDFLETGSKDGLQQDIQESLQTMETLAMLLRKRRQERGSLDFDFEEAYITLDSSGIPISVDTAERRVANRLIEEFMLVANETIAEHFYHLDDPFVYRVHEKPSTDKIMEFQNFLSSLGLRLKGSPDRIHPKALNEILDQVEGTRLEHVVNTVMLRSMKKAFYGTQCLGHFGLGVSYYCHFTSPIRRYPDLMIHRIIKDSLKGALSKDRAKQYRDLTSEAAERSSVMERKAEELEREVEKLKKAEYMSHHLQEEFDGIVSGVTSFGFFVELPNTIEGFVRVDSLRDDYFIYEADRYRLIGQKTGRTYTLGDKLRILVDSVQIERREVNFVLAVGVPEGFRK